MVIDIYIKCYRDFMYGLTDTEIIFAILSLTAAAVLISAGIKDAKSREVSDIHWLILGLSGAVGFFAICVTEDSFRWEYACMLSVAFLILYDILSDDDRFVLPCYLAMGVLSAAALYSMYDSNCIFFAAWASVVICYIIFSGAYVFGLIRGGADVKCLIALSMMFPVYPATGVLPVLGSGTGPTAEIFVFSVSVLFFSTILTVLGSAYYILTYSKEDKRGKKYAVGCVMSLERARKSHVWPKEDIIDGKLCPCGLSDEPEEIYDRLEKNGIEEVWTTPMIPFIIPIAVSTIFLIVVGNPLLLI